MLEYGLRFLACGYQLVKLRSSNRNALRDRFCITTAIRERVDAATAVSVKRLSGLFSSLRVEKLDGMTGPRLSYRGHDP
jgi:hypothetical protein